MGRKLSQQQRKVLAILPAFQDEADRKDVMTPQDVIAALGLEYTLSVRASISRALRLLREQGLILHVYGFSGCRQRKGYTRAAPMRLVSVYKRTVHECG